MDMIIMIDWDRVGRISMFIQNENYRKSNVDTTDSDIHRYNLLLLLRSAGP